MIVAMTCRCCPHGASAHRHYRAGTDCALCDCPRLQRHHWWQLRAPIGRTEPAPLVAPTPLTAAESA